MIISLAFAALGCTFGADGAMKAPLLSRFLCSSGFVPPLQGLLGFSDVTQGCARSSLTLGFYIFGPSALLFIAADCVAERG